MRCPKCDEGALIKIKFKHNGQTAHLCSYCEGLYKVKDEPNFVDLFHLELLVGEGVWQGYLLPTGLPTAEKKRNRIIPAKEVITKSLE